MTTSVYQPFLQDNASSNTPDNGLKAYVYTALKEGQIRLLKLHGVHNVADASEDAPLIGNIIISTLLNHFDASKSTTQSVVGQDDHNSKDFTKNAAKDATNEDDETDEPEFDALSYVWGGSEPRAQKGRVRRWLNLVDTNGQPSFLPISVNLEAALKSFRREVWPQGNRRELFLWVDAVCINQADHGERSSQISRMAAIYSEASLVRIWLGIKTEESQVAFDFIRHILSMEDFDKLIEDTITAGEWDAFRSLLQMSWFKRRWIIQEIAFAKKASVYCGQSQIPWKELAASISLFVDARYELRRMFRGAPATENSPDYLGEVDSYSAKTLVESISLMFRRSGDDVIIRNLVSLETLLTTLTPFEARDPHDSVYAVMHLSNDAEPAPREPAPREPLLNVSNDIKTAGEPWSVYSISSKQRRAQSPKYTISGRERVMSPENIGAESTQPLEVSSEQNGLSPEEDPPRGRPLHAEEDRTRGRQMLGDGLAPRPEASRSRSRGRSPRPPGAALAVLERRAARDNKSPSSKAIEKLLVKVDYSQSMFKLCIQVINWIVQQSRSIDIICKPWVPEISRALECEFYKVHPEDSITLPSWIQSLRKRTYGLDPTSNNKRYSRIAADPLVGSDSYGRKPYTASGTFDVRKGYPPPNLIHERHFRTRGFVLDIVKTTTHPALNGIIPNEWLALAGWDDIKEVPPEAFWRTLVANRRSIRGPQLPPHYWPQACHWSFRRIHDLANLNIEQLINNVHGVPSRRTLFFLERMRAVVWNRKLIQTQGFVDEATEDDPSWAPVLGLAPQDVREGDKIVILYGCSVPVVLRPNKIAKPKVARQNTKEIKKLSRKSRRATDQFVPYQAQASPALPTPSVSINGFATTPPCPEGDSSSAAPSTAMPEQTYTLIGECYLHSFMDGEAFDRNDDRKRDEDFILGCVEKCNCRACCR